MANGEEQRRAAELESQRVADQRLGDSGISEEPRASVLESGRRAPSYAFAEPPPPEPMAGGGTLESPGMELERQRAAEERMRQTAEAAFGGPEAAQEHVASRESRVAQPETTPDARRTTPGEEEETEEERGEEIDRAAFLRQQALIADRERERQAATETANLQVLEQNQQAYDMAKVGSAGTIFGPPVIMAYQTLREYFFPSPVVPKARFEEKVGCVTFFFVTLFGWLFMPPFFLGITLPLIVVIVYLLK